MVQKQTHNIHMVACRRRFRCCEAEVVTCGDIESIDRVVEQQLHHLAVAGCACDLQSVTSILSILRAHVGAVLQQPAYHLSLAGRGCEVEGAASTLIDRIDAAATSPGRLQFVDGAVDEQTVHWQVFVSPEASLLTNYTWTPDGLYMARVVPPRRDVRNAERNASGILTPLGRSAVA